MNIRIDRDRNTQFQTVIGNGMTRKKEKKEKLSGEELMIQQFKEQNSKENNRTAEIWGKFKAGSKLSPEELEYLAKEAPELYRQVREILMERQALEEQMAQAESKEEVAQIHANQLNKIQSSMGTGEQAAANAEKNMARVNHTQMAYQKFTASVEYKEKDDNESRAKERRDLLKELAWEQEIYRDKIAEKMEESQFETMEDEEIDAKEDILTNQMEDKDGENKRKKRPKKSNSALNQPFLSATLDLSDLQQKVRELYRSEGSSTVKTETAKGKDVDLSL